MDFNAVTVFIVLTVYCLIELLKKFVFKEDIKKKTLLPVCCIGLGALIALIIYAVYPQGINAGNLIEAVGNGGMSGLAATGTNQLWKQFQKYSGGFGSVDPDADDSNTTAVG